MWSSLFLHKVVHSEEQEIVVATIFLEDMCGKVLTWLKILVPKMDSCILSVTKQMCQIITDENTLIGVKRFCYFQLSIVWVRKIMWKDGVTAAYVPLTCTPGYFWLYYLEIDTSIALNCCSSNPFHYLGGSLLIHYWVINARPKCD